MPRGVMYVETRPASPEDLEAYHQWYNEVHLAELLSIDGFLSARRFEPHEHDGPYIAIYEFDVDDIDALRARMAAARGSNTSPVGVLMDPPPLTRFYVQITERSA